MKVNLIDIWTCQGGNCFYCHKPMSWKSGNSATSFTKDHFYPKSKGNKLNRNTVLAHEKCNYAKKDRDPTKQEVIQFRKLYRNISKRYKKLQKLQAKDRIDKRKDNEKKWAHTEHMRVG